MSLRPSPDRVSQRRTRQKEPLQASLLVEDFLNKRVYRLDPPTNVCFSPRPCGTPLNAPFSWLQFHFTFLQRVAFHVDGMVSHEMLQATLLHCR